MTPDAVLHRKLTQASRRVRGLLIARWMSRVLCWAALACLVGLAAAKLNWLAEPPLEVLGAAMALAALVGAGLGFLQKLTPGTVARLTDEWTGLKERLGTAVELAGRAPHDPLASLQVADAASHAGDLDLRKAYPIRMSREAIAFVVLALVLFGGSFLPNLPVFWSAERRQEIEEVKKQGVRIEKVARDADKAASKQQLDETKKAAREAQKLAEAMKRGNLDKKQAMVRMAKLTKQIQDQQKRLAAANAPAARPMEQAAADIKRALADRQKAVEEAAREKARMPRPGEGKKPGEKPGDKAGSKPGEKAGEKQTEAMQKAQQALQQFADALSRQDAEAQNKALQQLADQLQKGQMTPEELKTLSQQLQQMSQALKGTNLDKVAQQLQQIAQGMRTIKLDPDTLKKLAQMMKQAGGT